MRGPQKFKTSLARYLRQEDNDAEMVLWNELRGRRLNGFKFVRQLLIGNYFADFACREQKLVIEIDGSQHVNSQSDSKRNEFMNTKGWSILRFWANELLSQKQIVLNTIVEVLEGRLIAKTEVVDMKYLPAEQ